MGIKGEGVEGGNLINLPDKVISTSRWLISESTTTVDTRAAGDDGQQSSLRFG